MTGDIQVSGRVIAAARRLAGVSLGEFSTIAGLSVEALRGLEAGGSAWVQPDDSAAVSRALAHFGIIVIPESDGMGAGVRLKFTRQDVRQLTRLEGEGGVVASDDAP